MDAFYVIRAILREVIPVKRIVMRDAQSYGAILLDNNNRRTICRLYFNTAKKQVGYFNGKVEEKILLNDIDEIYAHADKLKAAAQFYASGGKAE